MAGIEISDYCNKVALLHLTGLHGLNVVYCASVCKICKIKMLFISNRKNTYVYKDLSIFTGIWGTAGKVQFRVIVLEKANGAKTKVFF